MKKSDNALFDITIRSHDGAEVCELVGISLFGKLSNITDKEKIGLYRDDELPDIENQMNLNLIA